jgi:formamidopyrimidine-DNA glycosylase
MPELPEVETVCWRLREGGHGDDALCGHDDGGRVVAAVFVDDATVVKGGDASALVGDRFVDVRRRGKWIFLVLTRQVLVVHLRMTGDLHVRPDVDADAARFCRLRLRLSGGRTLVFTDPRRFGVAHVVDDEAAAVALCDDLGADALAIAVDAFCDAVVGARAIKAVLLDQRVLAGVGNIYADEACFRACVFPGRRADSLDVDEKRRLWAGLREALLASIAASKEELAWRYENRSAPSPFLVYDRAGAPCVRCQATLASVTIAARTTVFCPACQPSPSTLPLKASKKTSSKKKASSKKSSET